MARVEGRLGLPATLPGSGSVTPTLAAGPARVVPVAVPPVVAVPVGIPAVQGSGERLEELARKRAAAMAAARTDALGSGSMVNAESVAPAREFAAIAMPQTDLGRAHSAQKPTDALGMERAIGGWVVAVVGSLFLVIGLVLGIKYGLDHGWFHFPPAYRCAAVGAVGLALIGAGQWVRRALGRSGGIAAAGLAGAGLAAIYGASVAAWGMFELYGAPTAFTLLALVSVGGVGLALWWGSLAVGVLALVGAYLNPIFLHNEHSDPRVLPVYLTAILALGLTLAAWRPSPFRWLRTVAWWGTVLIGSLWLVGEGGKSPFVALGFLAVVWVLVHAELMIGAARVSESTAIPGGTRNLLTRLSRPMRASFATTIWCVGAGILTVASADGGLHLEEWHVAAAGFAGTLALALVLAGHVRALRDLPADDRERLGVSLWAQAGALLITTIALGVGSWTQAIAWLSMGVAAIAAGRWARARSLDAYGLIVLCIGAGRLLVWDSWHTVGRGREVFGLVYTSWSLLMAMGGAVWLIGAWLMHRPSAGAAVPSRRRTVFVDLAIAVGVSLPFIGLVQEGRGVALGALAGVWALAMLVAAKWRDALLLRIFGVVILGMASVVSLFIHFDDLGLNTPTLDAARGLSAFAGLVLTKWTFVLLWLATVWLVGSWAIRSRAAGLLGATAAQRVSVGKWWGWGGSIGMIVPAVAIALLSLITRSTELGSVCIAWTLGALALVALHGRWRMLALDVMGLGTLGAAVLLWNFAYFIDHDWLAETRPAFSHPGLWVAMAIVVATFGACVWLWRGVVRRATWVPGVVVSVAIAGALLLGSTSLEIARSAGILLAQDHTAQAAALTLWWGVFAVAMLVAGFSMAIPVVRHLGLGLLGVAALKAVFFDLAGAAQGWRVVSFLGLGVLMMGVAIGYARLAAYLERQAKREGGAGMSAP